MADNVPLGTAESFECSLDGAPGAPCSSPHKVTGLSVGAHSFKVTLSSDSNSPKASSTWAWTVVALSCPTGKVGTPPDCKDPDPEPKPGRLGNLKVKHPKKLKSGKRLKVKVTVRNLGESPIAEVKVCLALPKRAVRPGQRTKTCRTIGPLSEPRLGRAGSGRQVVAFSLPTAKIKPKRKRPDKVKIDVSAFSFEVSQGLAKKQTGKKDHTAHVTLLK